MFFKMLYVNEFKTFCFVCLCCLNGIPISSVVSSVLKKIYGRQYDMKRETEVNEEEFTTK